MKPPVDRLDGVNASLRAEVERLRDTNLALECIRDERPALVAQLAAANALLEQVRMNCTLNVLAAFEPKTEDQATNAGRFSVALYLLKRIHSAVFGPCAQRAIPAPGVKP